LNDSGLEKIKSIALEVTDKLELVLVDVKLTAQGKRRVLLVTIHRRGSRINLDDCEKASRALEERLDELASGEEATPLASGYDLEVESPGIDRTLKTASELTIFTGEKVEVKLKETHESLGQAFTGELAGHANGVTRIINPQPLAVSSSKKAKQLAKAAPPPPPEVSVKDGSYISIKLYPDLSKKA
jgi:ribosome maturation factor RimP